MVEMMASIEDLSHRKPFVDMDTMEFFEEIKKCEQEKGERFTIRELQDLLGFPDYGFIYKVLDELVFKNKLKKIKVGVNNYYEIKHAITDSPKLKERMLNAHATPSAPSVDEVKNIVGMAIDFTEKLSYVLNNLENSNMFDKSKVICINRRENTIKLTFSSTKDLLEVVDQLLTGIRETIEISGSGNFLDLIIK
jgi:hypothetical protein